MFRRRTPAESAPAADRDESPSAPRGVTPPKDKPTPKRRDSARERRHYAAPRTRKEAYRRMRDDDRRKRLSSTRDDMLERDRGPVRAFARDYVDSRRSFGEYFLFLSLAIVVLLMIPGASETVTTFVWPVMMVAVVFEAMLVSGRVKREAAARFPNESLRGLSWYVAMRNLQYRRLRLPKPRVKPGDALPDDYR
ncbi:DUF3043 domain-containing protein [Allonocardiopsis opalescens]|uniref:DUF3043 family protein n=1 Tax=Allonocardiopsis opalescens TaxID=1144618 RepID=A0A2T0PZV6_9ACTN|nr:DUF3043 domain-containing protein [Allonocardiopsis opalescens]PRX97064.1 Protein of unknown function (DUF3043) [Allonocardiopsis opalescens]